MSTTPTTTTRKPARVGAAILAAAFAVGGASAVAGQDDMSETSLSVAEAANLQTAIEMFDKVFSADPTAIEAFGDVYIQHNPTLPNGPEPLIGLGAAYAGLDFPIYEVVRGFAQDDFVILHSHFRADADFAPDPDGPGFAVVDIFRFEDGKIVEHWDVLQPVVPADQSASGNDMFGQLTGQ